jgi:hypothetical protein
MPVKSPSFDMDRYISVATESVSYDQEAKELFLKMSRILARMVADGLGLSPSQYEIRVNKGGIAVSGEVTLHSDGIYVQFGQGILDSFLCRTCKGRKDFVGGQNHYYKWENLGDFERFLDFLRRMA